MQLNNLGIGIRLAMGFGFLLVLIAIANAVAIMQFRSVSTVNTRIIERDWIKAEAANRSGSTNLYSSDKWMIGASSRAEIGLARSPLHE